MSPSLTYAHTLRVQETVRSITKWLQQAVSTASAAPSGSGGSTKMVSKDNKMVSKDNIGTALYCKAKRVVAGGSDTAVDCMQHYRIVSCILRASLKI